jgi:transglutaminase-like putative cysteine protease
VTLVLMLYVHPDQRSVLRNPEKIEVEPALAMHDFIDSFGNRAARVAAPAGRLRLFYDNVAWDSGAPEPSIEGKILHPVDELPDDVLRFLLPSRYCEVDRMTQMAWDLFGKTPPTWERARAVVDWAHARIEFGYQYASPLRTAFDAAEQGKGVCRDYMHLAITLLRAMNIPARYATGYLGDIGVPPVDSPMDFSAFLEVYLSGRWWAMDARHNERRIGRIKQGHGRDATDVAISTSFGSTTLQTFRVWTDEIKS